LVTVAPMLKLVRDWKRYLADPDGADLAVIPSPAGGGSKGEGISIGPILHRHESTGRPLGDEGFVTKLESLVGRPLKPQKRRPKPKRKSRTET